MPLWESELMEAQRVSDNAETEHPYDVVIFNDPVTPFQFVVAVMVMVFGYDEQSAWNKTMEIHRSGSGVAGSYAKEEAYDKLDKLEEMNVQSGFLLQAEVRKE